MYKLKNIQLALFMVLNILFSALYSQGQTAKFSEILLSANQSSFSAGQDATICNNREFITEGVAIPCLIIMWQSSGDGTFENSSELQTVYTPGAQDIIDGIVTLKLILFPLGGGGNDLMYDEMNLYINHCRELNNL